ncbi:putative GMC oxidoreductase [Delitschia confertaspora ATCC 74209]|uniref:GMC oxidoreductase n=1 Tax=Delitschia confertaspora ATCC 74209 TaxID=1513339 RepID=A0A9P4JHW1_9PLEO|nr:putative GMC oxidoreductase [Delitschia confertaspora ATCC 74209]
MFLNTKRVGLVVVSLLSVLPSSFQHPLNGRASNATSVDSYDYVVVGSGPGGGPLSARLAIAGFKVLLIDAGDDQGATIEYQVPVLHVQASEYGPMSWSYYVNHYSDPEKQKKDSKMTWETPSGELFVGPSAVTGTGAVPAGSKPKGILYPRAGTLGGCSAHNALITVYPHKSDWNGIAAMSGDSSWGADNMRKYFQKLERSQYLPNGVVGHGFNGWLRTMVSDLTLVVQDFKLLSMVLATATAMGQNLIGKIITTVTGLAEVLIRDLNADTPERDSKEGLYLVPLAMDNYHRVGPREFILDTANAKNPDGSRKYHLDVMLNTLVTNVKFDTSGSKPKATGVEFMQGQSLYRAHANSQGAPSGFGSVDATREVIIAAGAFNTPQLLKLSGIGPADELKKNNIAVLVDLPGVGTNLQDRYETSFSGITQSEFALTKDCTFNYGTDPCLKQWQNNAILKGPYGTNGLAFAAVKKSSVSEGDSDLFIAGAPVYFTGYYPGYSNFTESHSASKRHWAWVVLKAHSRNNAGTVELRSNDPRDTPVINFNSFAKGGEQDIQALYEGMQFSRQTFKDLIPLDGSFKEVWPGAETKSEAAMKEFIQNEAWGHHACCTAAIGSDGDKMSVLDSSFRVRGVEGLRVVDASVFPKIPGFYIAAPIYMISEKAADVIIADAKK